MTFRQLAKQLHPDANGDHSKVVEFTELMRRRRNECLCGCGRQRPRNNGKFYTSICSLRYRYPQLKVLAACLVAIACLGATFPKPTVPPSKKKVKATALHSPRGAEIYMATPMAIVAPPRTYSLMWDYPIPLPQTNLEFVVEMRPDFNSPWQVLGVTNIGSFPINTTAPQMMYRVASRWKQ